MRSVRHHRHVDRYRLWHHAGAAQPRLLACSAACASRRTPIAWCAVRHPNFVPLIFDVTDEAAVHAAAGEVRAALGGETLAGLVNNAGIAVSRGAAGAGRSMNSRSRWTSM